ncbi:MAG: hypothetical protein JWP00_1479 [Chloroflexi bacterium]|jgi:uncharacterized protein YlaN (UPF0358 family)|nr:hypothetical protein [Chloroflexota bacterium]
METEKLSLKARKIITGRLERAARLKEADLFLMNLSLPQEFKYRSVSEVQTVMVKGAFDALAFSVELGLFTKQEATEYWKELHDQFSQIWPGGAVA